MKVVLKAKKETSDSIPLPCKIKAEAFFEGQGMCAERRARLQKIHHHSFFLWHTHPGRVLVVHVSLEY